MNEQQLSTLLQSASNFPPPKVIKVSYGTAGFRADASILKSTVFRIGILAALRSLKTGGDVIGLMITASHNKVDDNGVKIADPSGGMLSQLWEPFADHIANAQDAQTFLKDSMIEWWKAMEGARVMIRGFGDLVAKLGDKVVMEVLVRCWSDGDVVPTSVPKSRGNDNAEEMEFIRTNGSRIRKNIVRTRECGELHVDVRVFKSMRRVFQLRVEYKRTNEIDNYVKFRYYQNEVKKKLGRPSS
ncbi:phosphoacetylglucosamine mutase [Tanacetum coccineum]